MDNRFTHHSWTAAATLAALIAAGVGAVGPFAVPGTIEAGDFDPGGEGVGYHENTPGNQGDVQLRAGESVDLFASVGGTYVVKNFEAGEWLAYTINVPNGGQYDFELNAATHPDFPDSAFRVEVDGVSSTGTVVLPNTGGWSNFQWLGKTRLALSSGSHVLRIVSERPYFAFDSIRLAAAPAPRPYSGTPASVPGTLDGAHFDLGDEGVGYHDDTPGNQGDAQFRMEEGVDIFYSNDAGGGAYSVKNFAADEWLAYTIRVPATGKYDIELRAATQADFPNPAFHVEIDGVNVTSSVVLPDTGGWSNYQWLGRKTVTLSAGTRVLKVVSERPYFALSAIRVTATVAEPIRSTPYLGTPTAVPGTFEAEHFDLGGEGVGHHDTTAGNQGDAQFRTGEGVDLFSSSDQSGSPYIIKNFEAGEWLAYTVNVPASGPYDIELRAATSPEFPDRAIRVEVDGVDATGTVVLPNTGGWSNYQWIGKKRLTLDAGVHVLKIVSDRPYFSLNSVRLTAPDASAAEFSCTFAVSPTDCGFSEQAKVSGRASLVNDVARDGATALRLHTEPGDNNVANSGTSERNDVLLSQAETDGSEGREGWWAHSILFPDDFTAPTWHQYVVFDFHNTAPGDWQANFHVAFQRQSDLTKPGLLSFIGYGGVNSGDGRFDAIIGPITKNVWYDFVYHVRWSSGSDGFFDAWVNGKKVMAHRGATLYAGQGVYLKLANYHVPVCDPYPACVGTHEASSVIHDRVIRGTDALAVSSGPLEGVAESASSLTGAGN